MKQTLIFRVHSDHAHEAGEQGDDHGGVHVGLTHLPLNARQRIRNGQHEESGDHTAAAGNEEGVQEHSGEVHNRKVREQRLIVIKGICFGQEGGYVLTNAVTEGLHDNPEEGAFGIYAV